MSDLKEIEKTYGTTEIKVTVAEITGGEAFFF
jgi:hypothetical protein